MKKLKITEATGSLADYTKSLDREPLVVTAHGKPVAALVPIEGMDMEQLAVGTNPKFLDLIEQSRRRALEEGTYSAEEVRRLLNIKPMRTRKANGRKTGRGTGNTAKREK